MEALFLTLLASLQKVLLNEGDIELIGGNVPSGPNAAEGSRDLESHSRSDFIEVDLRAKAVYPRWMLPSFGV